MKICSLELQNFRKFTGRFRVDGIGEGLNVLVGPNEYGKSTLLDAINGVIFEKATAQSERTRGFRHFRDGAVPQVLLAFESAEVGLGPWKTALAEALKATGQIENRLAGLKATLDDKRSRLAVGRSRASEEELERRANERRLLAQQAAEALAKRVQEQGETVDEIDLRIKRKEAEGRQRVEEIHGLDTQISGTEKWIEANEGIGNEELLDLARADVDRWQRLV